MTKIAAREQKLIHTLLSTMMVGRQQLSGKLEEIRFTAWGKVNLFCLTLPSAIQNSFSHISLLPQNRYAGGCWC